MEGGISSLGVYQGVHNVFLMLWGEAGLFVLMGFCLFLFQLFIQLVHHAQGHAQRVVNGHTGQLCMPVYGYDVSSQRSQFKNAQFVFGVVVWLFCLL